MNLPFLNKTSETQKNFFLSLLIKPFKIGAILFEEVEGKLVILGTHEIEQDKEINELTTEELLIAADRAISAVEPNLPEGASVDKTIFSVPATWVVEGKITGENLAKLKKICEDLGLVPMGYLMSIEAIVHFIQRNEGAPISAVFIESAGEKIFVYLVKGGKITEYREAVAGESTLSSVEGMLRSFEADVLPSKIILLDHTGSIGTQQEFLSHTWPEDIPFLHLPQVMTLERGLENEATVNGVASQMDLEVAHGVKSVHEADSDKGEPTENFKKEENEDFGFLKEKDIKEENKESVNPEDDNLPGFVNEGVADEGIENVREVSDSNIMPFRRQGEEEDVDGVAEEDVRVKPRSGKPAPLAMIASIAGMLKIPRLPMGLGFIGGSAMKIKLAGVVIGVILIAFLFSFAYYNYFLRADITVFADQITIDDGAEVVFGTGGEGDIIPIEIIVETSEGEHSKNATGTLETGEKAKGAITIFNKTESPKTFEKGMVIVGPNDLEFVLQEEIRVASTSAFSTSLASAEGDVLASKFGTEYNLPSNSNFTIEGSSASLYIGKNSNAITGGTKEEKTVVSQKDLNDLEAAIVEKLEKEALAAARQGISGGEMLLTKAISSEITDREFDKEVGDEAQSVAITATVEYSVGKYRNEDLAGFIAQLSDRDIPDNYSFSENNSSIDIAELDIEDAESISAKLNVNAVYVPNIEASEISTRINGKSQSFAEDEIGKIDGVRDVVIKFRNSLPLFPKLIPNNAKNITIEFKSEG